MANIGFIGAGNIATAIIGGVIRSGYITTENINIYDIDLQKCEKLSIYGVRAVASVTELIEKSDYIFLTVKPQIFMDVLCNIRVLDNTEKVFVSVGAGITISYIKEHLQCDAKVIRAMPNTPLLYGNGATALVHADPVTDEEFDFVRGIFGAAGVTCVVDEHLMNTVTGVTGSSPAFIFRFARELIAAGVKAGMAETDANQMVIQTLLGSAVMLQQGKMSPNDLIQMVASPNGTTVAGLQALDSAEFDSAIQAAVSAAIKRADELSK